jgi:hypothetical protein
VLSALLGAVLLIEALPFPMLVSQMTGLAVLAAGLAFQIQVYQQSHLPSLKVKG